MIDTQKSAVRQEVKHHMGRRCFNWDYSSRCIYMITITLADRSWPVLGQLVGEGEEWRVEPSEIGLIVEQCWREIPQQWPGVEIIESQLMPDHFHGIIFVKEQQQKKLGNIIGSFKSKSSSRAGAVGLWAPGYVDLILFRAGQLEKMIAYIRDNPLRLGVKRAHPELFKVARDIEVDLGARAQAQNHARGEAQNHACSEAQGHARAQAQNHACSEAQGHGFGETGCAPARGRAGIPPWRGPAKGHFMAIGNHFLLARPIICQIQCSRSFFAYKRRRLPGGWQICRDSAGKPIVEKSTPEFEEKATAAMRAAAQGAVLLSPCISHGEREITRRAFEAGHRVITLQNKGFSPLYKPGGKLFETCAAGNLLMLAPIGWPYVPGEKVMTRHEAQVLNRIAQLIADDGAVEIDYKGAVLSGIDEAVAQAVAGVDFAARGEAQNRASGEI